MELCGCNRNPRGAAGVCTGRQSARPWCDNEPDEGSACGALHGVITNWKDIGGDDQPIVLVNRVVGSGTRANMAKYLFDGDDSRFAASAAEGENAEVAQAVRETPGAISYLGLAYLSGMDMHVFAIEGVQATRATIQSGAWPITAQGYVMTKGRGSASSQAFLPFLTSSGFQQSDAFAKLGFVPIIE